MFIIEAQRDHSCPAGGSAADNMCTAISPLKMVSPSLGAWVIEGDQHIRNGILRISTRTFKLITTITAATKVLEFIITAARLRDDVVNNQRHANQAPRRLAIFASLVRT